MTVIRSGPHTEPNISVIEGNTEADRQIPMWGHRCHQLTRPSAWIDYQAEAAA